MNADNGWKKKNTLPRKSAPIVYPVPHAQL